MWGIPLMRTGDVITATIGAHRIDLVLDDAVIPDRTCGQYDAGFWAYTADQWLDDDAPEYFVSSYDGSVYGPDDTGHVTRYIGSVESVSTPQDD